MQSPRMHASPKDTCPGSIAARQYSNQIDPMQPTAASIDAGIMHVTGLSISWMASPIDVTLAAQNPLALPVTERARLKALPHTIALNVLPIRHLITWGTENLRSPTLLSGCNDGQEPAKRSAQRQAASGHHSEAVPDFPRMAP